MSIFVRWFFVEFDRGEALLSLSAILRQEKKLPVGSKNPLSITPL